MEINGWFSVLRSNAFNISLSNTKLHTLAIEHKPSRLKPSFGLVKVNKYPEISLNYLKVFDIIVQWVSICLIVFSKMLEQDQTFLIINQEGRSTLTKIKQDPQMLLILSFEKYTIVNEILNAFDSGFRRQSHVYSREYLMKTLHRSSSLALVKYKLIIIQ